MGKQKCTKTMEIEVLENPDTVYDCVFRSNGTFGFLKLFYVFHLVIKL